MTENSKEKLCCSYISDRISPGTVKFTATFW